MSMVLAREPFLEFGYGVRLCQNELNLHGEVVRSWGRVVIRIMIDYASIRLGEKEVR